jgi:5S rRNA maturation endonuclease (ribonuclease M5)
MDWMVQKEQYAEYLRRLDARALLDHYGAENCHEVPNRDGTTEIVHSCLLDRVEPHHAHGDDNPSACFNVDKKVYVCYAGGWSGDAFHLIAKLEGVEAFVDILPMVGPLLEGAVAEVPLLQEQLTELFAQPTTYAVNLPAYDSSVLAAWDRPHVYWNHRGITHEAQKLLRLGYDENECRIVFPHFVHNTLVGWQKRVIPGETRPELPKYKNSPGFPKAETLYAWDLLDEKTALVVESPMSVAKAYSLGVRNAVATFGASVTQGQIDLLKPLDRVIIWFDADPAGEAGELKLLEALHRHAEVWRVRPAYGKDLADIETVEEFLAYTATHQMPAFARLAEIDLLQKFRRPSG